MTSGVFSDKDTNAVIRPDADHVELLTNRHGKANVSGTMECEINLLIVNRPFYSRWITSMVGTTITATGVNVDDNGHDDTTELHPMDLVAGRVRSSLNSQGDWMSRLASDKDLRIGRTLFAYRYAAASDSRKGCCSRDRRWPMPPQRAGDLDRWAWCWKRLHLEWSTVRHDRPGAFREEGIVFRPKQAGAATAVWTVQTNAEGPKRVQLSGRGRSGTPQ